MLSVLYFHGQDYLQKALTNKTEVCYQAKERSGRVFDAQALRSTCSTAWVEIFLWISVQAFNARLCHQTSIIFITATGLASHFIHVY